MTNSFREIDYYLVHTVDINHITASRGDITYTTETDIPTRIVERTEVTRGSSGDSIGTSDVAFRVTILYFKPTQSIGFQDEIVIDGVTKPVRRIELVRDAVGIRFKRVFI